MCSEFLIETVTCIFNLFHAHTAGTKTILGKVANSCQV